jgi:uncharacterized protein YecE (DUF72 family)
MLAFYSRHFPLVELNFTFYRPPSASALARLAEQTPEGFQFIVKVPRTLSHDRDPRDLPGFRLAIEEFRQRGRLAGLLCQLPQSQHHNRSNLAWLDVLAGGLADCRMAVEFRHRSWFRPDVASWLQERRLDLVSVDVPDLGALYPRGLVHHSPRLYLRLHSRKADNWYRSGPERYDYDYNDAELTEWIESLRAIRERAERVFILFNNCHGGQAATNAQRMQRLLAGTVLEPSLVAPPGPAAPESRAVQRSLFEED